MHLRLSKQFSLLSKAEVLSRNHVQTHYDEQLIFLVAIMTIDGANPYKFKQLFIFHLETHSFSDYVLGMYPTRKVRCSCISQYILCQIYCNIAILFINFFTFHDMKQADIKCGRSQLPSLRSRDSSVHDNQLQVIVQKEEVNTISATCLAEC